MYPYCDFCQKDFGDTCDLNYFQPYQISHERYVDLRRKLLKAHELKPILNLVRRTGHLTLFPSRYQLCSGCFKQFLKYRVKHIYLVPDTFTIETYVITTDTNDYEFLSSESDDELMVNK